MGDVDNVDDIDVWAGQSGLMLRWRYHDDDEDAFDWYVQVDDVALTCNMASCEVPPVTEICTAVVSNPGISIDNLVLDEGNSGRQDAPDGGASGRRRDPRAARDLPPRLDRGLLRPDFCEE